MKTLILNLDFSPLSVVNVHRGLTLSLYNEDMSVLEYYDNKVIYSEKDVFELPAVMLYRKHVKSPVRKTISKKYVLYRDDMMCQYCSIPLDNKTASIDHIIPASFFKTKLEANTWENLVACCKSCNTKKRNRKPECAGMKLKRDPKKPHGFITISSGPEIWRKYIKNG